MKASQQLYHKWSSCRVNDYFLFSLLWTFVIISGHHFKLYLFSRTMGAYQLGLEP